MKIYLHFKSVCAFVPVRAWPSGLACNSKTCVKCFLSKWGTFLFLRAGSAMKYLYSVLMALPLIRLEKRPRAAQAQEPRYKYSNWAARCAACRHLAGDKALISGS